MKRKENVNKPVDTVFYWTTIKREKDDTLSVTTWVNNPLIENEIGRDITYKDLELCNHFELSVNTAKFVSNDKNLRVKIELTKDLMQMAFDYKKWKKELKQSQSVQLLCPMKEFSIDLQSLLYKRT